MTIVFAAEIAIIKILNWKWLVSWYANDHNIIHHDSLIMAAFLSLLNYSSHSVHSQKNTLTTSIHIGICHNIKFRISTISYQWQQSTIAIKWRWFKSYQKYLYNELKLAYNCVFFFLFFLDWMSFYSLPYTRIHNLWDILIARRFARQFRATHRRAYVPLIVWSCKATKMHVGESLLLSLWWVSLWFGVWVDWNGWNIKNFSYIIFY